MDWLGRLGARQLQREKVSRADFAFDFHLQAVDFQARNVVSRLKKSAEHRENQTLQTIRFGTGDIVIRIYDKTAEILQSSGKTWLYDIWGEKNDVWRVEFQLRGEALRGRGIRMLDQLWSLAPDLLLELSEHTSLRHVGRDTNRSRWRLHPLWQALLEAIEAMPRTQPQRFFERGDTVERRLSNIEQQVYGLVIAYCALDYLRGRRAAPTSLSETVDHIGGTLAEGYSETMFRQAVQTRVDRYRFEGGL